MELVFVIEESETPRGIPAAAFSVCDATALQDQAFLFISGNEEKLNKYL